MMTFSALEAYCLGKKLETRSMTTENQSWTHNGKSLSLLPKRPHEHKTAVPATAADGQPQ